MPVGAGSPVFVDDARARLALVVALGVEYRSISRIHDRLGLAENMHVLQSGPGAARARSAARAALASGARALMCIGLGGGVDAHVAVGDVIVARAVVDQNDNLWDCDAAWLEAVVRALAGRVHVGTLLSVDKVVATPAAKAAAAERYAALACDMEAAAIAEVAAAARVPFLAIRVISDGPEDALPAHVDRWLDERGDSRIAPVLGSLLNPGQWSPLIALIRGYRRASAVLESVVRQLAPATYGCLGAR